VTVLRYCVFAVAIVAAVAQPCRAQAAPEPDTRTQYPPLLANGFFGLNLGAIDVPLTAAQLQPGFRAASIRTPRPALQITLFGREFNRYLSGEMNYTRSMEWATYDNINGTGQRHSVWVVLGEFKLRARFPLTSRTFAYGDAGIAITSRHGASMADHATLVKNAHYPALLVGGGLGYRVNERWSLLAGVTRAAASQTHRQPRALLFSSGVRYHFRPLPAARVERALRGSRLFPKHVVTIGYAAGLVGFGPNRFFSKTIPIFWGGNLTVDRGFMLRYEQNLFHTEKWLAFDLGVSLARWRVTATSEHLGSLSVNPTLRFIVMRARSADLHVSYSLGGPAWLSRSEFNGVPIGTNRFSFQDRMDVSILAGKTRQFAIGVGLNHYSNGNLFPINPGIAVPLTLTLGYAF
jgi:hypothetical protein